jgi:ferritin-like metal-binding protein YciE
MTRTASAAALLHVALQDLHAGKAMQVERLPRLIGAVADAELKAILSDETGLTAVQRDRLAGLADLHGAPANLWMAGILDDAERDTESHQPGRLVDVAVLGAVRKAKAAEIVSSETALSLANREAASMLETLRANRSEEVATDHRLRARLLALTVPEVGLFS